MGNKLGITEGLIGVQPKINNGYVGIYSNNGEIKIAEVITNPFNDENELETIANAMLYCNAHNTANKCGKLPSQLLQENEEMKARLEFIKCAVENSNIQADVISIEEIEQLLTKINQ